MAIKPENEREEELIQKASPYERLKFIYEFCLFYTQEGIKEDVTHDDFQQILDKILKMTEKYK